MTQIYANKITPEHLKRKAIIYMRQSTAKQVRENKESQRLQYDLKRHAKELGFRRVEVIDWDLGSSAAIGAAPRLGFEYLVGMIALGDVGLLLCREVSRLSRTDKDWCQVLEVCQLFGTLIGDAENIYDLKLLDDQLILGIKGTMSVVELKILKMRLIAGMEEKARRGEFNKLLPPGYVYEMGKPVKDHNQRIREAVELIFLKFTEIRSIRQTFLWFHSNEVELPVNKSCDGKIRIVWQLPSKCFVQDVLKNPFYAGAYVWGRRPTKMKVIHGKIKRVSGRILEPEECKVLIRDHHEGYIDWQTFEENRKIIRGNYLRMESDDSVIPIRAGQGILVGLLRCGRCGRKMHVRYWGKSGTAARYLCKGDFESGGRYCQAFGGGTVDRRFSMELLKVISPLGVRASLEAIQLAERHGGDKYQALDRQREQLEYEAKRAFEQYNEVDPRNRLVAVQLERRWNESLEAVEALNATLEAMNDSVQRLTEPEKEAILELGENFAQVWESEHCSPQTKKQIIGTVVKEAVVTLVEPDNVLRFVIHWQGGSHTTFEMPKPVSPAGKKTATEDLDLIRRMAIRYGDGDIARVLNKLGRRTGKDKRWSQVSVRTARQQYAIPGQKRTKADPEILTLAGAVKYSGVSDTTIRRLVQKRILSMSQVAPWAPWEIKRSDIDSERVQEIIQRLKRTGKLHLEGDNSEIQETLFQETQGLYKGGYHD